VTWGKTGRARWAALSVACALLALGAKENAITLPLFAAAAALCLRRRGRRSRAAVGLLLLSSMIPYLLVRHALATLTPPPGFGGHLAHTMRMMGYYFSKPAMSVLDAIEIGDVHRLDIAGLGFAAALILLLLRDPAPTGAFLSWKVAFYLPVSQFQLLETRYYYLPAAGTCALIALLCWQGYVMCRRAAPHLSAAPLLAWAWIAAHYALDLAHCARQWAGMLER